MQNYPINKKYLIKVKDLMRIKEFPLILLSSGEDEPTIRRTY